MPLPCKLNMIHSFIDGDLRADVLGLEALYYMQANKLEVGAGTGDPYVEAIHRYRADVQSRTVTVPLLSPLTEPCGAWTGGQVLSYLLCPPQRAFHTSRTNQNGTAVSSRLASQVDAFELHRRHPTLHVSRGPPADFPFIDFYRDKDDDRHTFAYIAAFEDKRIFQPILLLEEMREKVLTGLSRLHENGVVHGDVRDVNVLVRNEDAPSESDRDVLLIDWDWSDPTATVQNPAAASSAVERPDDNKGGIRMAARLDIFGYRMWYISDVCPYRLYAVRNAVVYPQV
ncbi:hypothetical protein BN946_scf185002.g111 [Trametes cinnabarina]|uniref:Protein kinase domain-containing protein n=1 Tax=Pycnoporus cinnabarinus TaxID=5643 RepID=A0A060SFF1_PYCCI|nr:hypothetical protein BN946_scf185002.g111 [Trametes cinnabarina]